MQPSRTKRQQRMRRAVCQFCLLLVLTFADGHALVADTYSDRRVTVGLSLFRALLVADQDAEARVDAAGTLPVLVLYAEDKLQADGYAETLQQELATIREHPTRVDSIAFEAYLARDEQAPLAIFIAERLTGSELESLVQSAIAGGVILFSPFEGDVEKGVLAGLSVQASVRPYINLKVLNETGVSIKPFYLRVARTYE